MIRIQVYAGSKSADDHEQRPPTIVDHGHIAESQVHEVLRHIGLEYKTADYFPERQVIIVLDPVIEQDLPVEVKQKMHELADALKGRS
jgi:hypothetical protein